MKGDYKKKVNELLKNANKIRYINSIEAINISREALELSNKYNYQKGKAEALLIIGGANISIGEFDIAIASLFEALEISKKLELLYNQANISNLIAIIFNELGYYEKSLEYYIKGLNISNNIGKKSMQAIILNNIGEIYRIQGFYDEALKYYNECIEIEKKFSFKATKGCSILNIGEVYYMISNYEKGIKSINRALKYFEKHSCKIYESEAYNQLALLYNKKGQVENAHKYFQKAIELSEKVSDKYFEVDILLDYHLFLKDISMRAEALEYLNKAHLIAKKQDFKIKMPRIYEALARYYEEDSDVLNSYKYYKMYYESQKSYEEDIKKQKLHTLKFLIQIENIQKEKEKIENENLILLNKSKNLEKSYNDISIISSIGQKITATLNIEEMVKIIYEDLYKLFDISCLGIAIYNSRNKIIDYDYFIEDNKKYITEKTDVNDQNSLAAYCIRNKEIVIINNMNNEYKKYIKNIDSVHKKGNVFDTHSIIYCPLIIKEDIIGALTVQSHNINAFTEYHIEMIKTLTSFASIAINNAEKSKHLEIEIKNKLEAQKKLEEANKKLKKLSEVDWLTNVMNRRKFDEIFQEKWNSSISQNKYISLIMLDIDHFKEYNDNYGHLEGDKCIISVTNIINGIINDNAYVARYGGDEFLILVPDSKPDEVVCLAEKIRIAIQNHKIKHEYSKVSNYLSVSLGIVSNITNNNSIIDFIKKADNALYIAKQRGKNQTVLLEN